MQVPTGSGITPPYTYAQYYVALLVTAQHRRGLGSSVDYTLPYLPKMYGKLEVSTHSFDQNGVLFKKGSTLIKNRPFT